METQIHRGRLEEPISHDLPKHGTARRTFCVKRGGQRRFSGSSLLTLDGAQKRSVEVNGAFSIFPGEVHGRLVGSSSHGKWLGRDKG
jgi:hypothetical protein